MYDMVNTYTGRKFDTVIFYNPEEYSKRGIQVFQYSVVGLDSYTKRKM